MKKFGSALLLVLLAAAVVVVMWCGLWSKRVQALTHECRTAVEVGGCLFCEECGRAFH